MSPHRRSACPALYAGTGHTHNDGRQTNAEAFAAAFFAGGATTGILEPVFEELFYRRPSPPADLAVPARSATHHGRAFALGYEVVIATNRISPPAPRSNGCAGPMSRISIITSPPTKTAAPETHPRYYYDILELLGAARSAVVATRRWTWRPGRWDHLPGQKPGDHRGDLQPAADIPG